MNILDEEKGQKGLKLNKGKMLILFSILLTLVVGFLTRSLDLTILSSILILVSAGVVTTKSWNNELKKDGYASLMQLYTFYVSSLFLFIAFFPVVSNLVDLAVALPVSFTVCLSYAIILNNIAFYDIDENEHNVSVKTYMNTPSVVYMKDGDYMNHIEKMAKKEINSSEKDS